LIQSFAVNSLNELSSASRSGTLTVAGTTTEVSSNYPGAGSFGVYSVKVNSVGASVYEDGAFAAAGFTPADGNNTFTAVAQDGYGRLDTNSITAYLPASPSYTYDLNGNLLSDGTRNFTYDDENQLVSVWVANTWSNNFVYDGLLRKRIERDYGWTGSAWIETNEVRFIYDGYLAVQERDGNNLPQVTYTRGNDLSGSLQDAGGIGGLLARTDMGLWTAGSGQASAFYHTDGNGNITCMVNTNGTILARYEYDPYGNMLSMSGPLANANRYRFSSKEWNDNAGLYYYGFRFYDPNLQRWVNRDPIQEWGGYNLFAFISNVSVNAVDAFGFCDGDQPKVPDFLNLKSPPWDLFAPNNLTPADIWPPLGFPPSPFPQQPSKHPLSDAGKALGKGLANAYGNQAKQYANNVLNNLGIDPSKISNGEQLGLGAAAGVGLYGAGQGISFDHNFTKHFSAGFSINPSGPGFKSPSSCNVHVGFGF
jgi:RHS repeat-associated protein